MTSNADFYEEVANAIERMQKRIDELEGKSTIREAKNVLTDLKRERNLARSERETSANEMAILADKLNTGRNEIEAQIKAAETRHEVQMEAMRKQVMHVYDNNAETQSAVEQMRQLRDEVNQMSGTLIERQDNIVKNIDDRYENFDRMAGNEYLAELHRDDANKRSNTEISNEIQRQMRLMNPTAFAEPDDTQEV